MGFRHMEASSVIYFISDENNRVKIGYTSGTAEDRLKQLQTGNAEKLKLIVWMKGSRLEELKIHRHLNHYRLEGEWFRLEGTVKEFILLVESLRSNEWTNISIWLDAAHDDQLSAVCLMCRILNPGL